MPNIVINNSEKVRINSSVTIILDHDQVELEYDLKDGEYDILIFNDHDGDMSLHETGSISNAKVRINYLQLEDHDLKQNNAIEVNKDSELSIFTTYLGVRNKEVRFDLYNKETDSRVDIYNNIVCLQDADFSMDCNGIIVKGAKRAKAHQSSHCLTIDAPKRARVLPVLQIDEDDVEASHSLAAGTIDEEVMFYMNSRGLNKKEALNLILKSYLMPSDDFYDAFEDGRSIQERAIKKVDDICSM
ncbi:MAG: SufD family Fe-S cluster assembly protein [Erysipelotrichaceae bacterium]|nr:SufD family Fe-S cluster assembly protein [Erysipelotrichaceae bacterium]